jgi:excisionase family DNA binding protein
MPQGFYTLEEAARKLGVSAATLNQMAQKREVRAFADRGTWRFRAEEIDELVRRKSQQSDPDMKLAEPPPASPRPSTPRPKRKSDVKRPAAETKESGGLFPFELESTPKSGRSSDIFAAENEPAKAPGSDSDVRLVPDGSDISLNVAPEVSGPPRTPAPSSGRGKTSGKVSDSDSEVKLVDISAQQEVAPPRTPRPSRKRDSEVRLQDDPRGQKDPDSGVRIERSKKDKDPEGSDSTLMIEKLDLDAELDSAEASSLTAPAPAPGKRASPFELSSESAEEPKSATPSSSDFDLSLKPDSDESSPLSMFDSSSEQPAKKDAGSDSSAESSLLSLSDPGGQAAAEEAEGSDEDLSFELTIEEEGPATPRPAKPAKKPAASDSSSEFELTIEDDSALSEDSSLTSSELKAQLKGKMKAKPKSADTELQTSDFELAVDEDEDDETRRETEVIIEEDADEAAETALGPSALEDMEEPVDDLFIEPDAGDLMVEDEDVEAQERIKVIQQAPAEWGPWSLLHVPTTLVMVVIGFLLFEMLRAVYGMHQPTQLGNLLFDQISSFMK